jgi:hypothetical protein
MYVHRVSLTLQGVALPLSSPVLDACIAIERIQVVGPSLPPSGPQAAELEIVMNALLQWGAVAREVPVPVEDFEENTLLMPGN